MVLQAQTAYPLLRQIHGGNQSPRGGLKTLQDNPQGKGASEGCGLLLNATVCVASSLP